MRFALLGSLLCAAMATLVGPGLVAAATDDGGKVLFALLVVAFVLFPGFALHHQKRAPR